MFSLLKRFVFAQLFFLLISAHLHKPSIVEAQQTADLRQQLRSGLKATRAQEFEFIDRVVLAVDQRRLPIGLVYTVFDKAKGRRPQYPFPYFKQAMQIVARRYNVAL